jgi:hypothetical protein
MVFLPVVGDRLGALPRAVNAIPFNPITLLIRFYASWACHERAINVEETT